MKLTRGKLKKMIAEELLKEGFKDDVKAFQSEVGQAEAGWKEKYSQLEVRENSMKSVNRVHRSLKAVVEGFKKMPMEETLGMVGKGHSKKFQNAISVLEGILEDTGVWIKENH